MKLHIVVLMICVAFPTVFDWSCKAAPDREYDVHDDDNEQKVLKILGTLLEYYEWQQDYGSKNLIGGEVKKKLKELNKLRDKALK